MQSCLRDSGGKSSDSGVHFAPRGGRACRSFWTIDHSGRSIKVASRHFINVASTLPHEGGLRVVDEFDVFAFTVKKLQTTLLDFDLGHRDVREHFYRRCALDCGPAANVRF